MLVSKLKDDQIIELIRLLPDHFLQARKMIEFLGQTPKTPTGKVANHCAIGNLSDVARKANPYIYSQGFFIGCERPAVPIINKFKERSNQYLWSIYFLPKAVNDAEY